MKEKKEMIKKFLKEVKMASTGKIASKIRANQKQTTKYLKELEEGNEVKKLATPTATYWELKK